MSVREPKIIEFDNIALYLDWYAEQYQAQNGIKVCGLSEIDNGRMKAEYIELF